jgi:FkbM family methyltransferase
MSKHISNAQNFEDIYLYRAYSLIKNMFGNISATELIVDIGAWEPIADNVSAFFIEIGWGAMLVEPQLAYYEKLVSHFHGNSSVRVRHAAVSNTIGEGSFFVPEVTTGWGSLEETHSTRMKEDLKKEIVSITTLDDIHNDLKGNYFILKVDAEESERDIVSGWQSSEIGPILICIEDQDDRVRLLLESRNYKFFFFDGINSYFVKAVFYNAVQKFNPINLLEDYTFTLRDGTWLVNNDFRLKDK